MDEKEELEKLKTENEELKRMNAVKSDLISISAHQLRTSLSALKWILQMFIDKDLGKLTTEQEGFVQKALDSNERMIVLVNDLLTLNHADNTEIKFNFKEVNILELLEQTLFEFYGESRKKEVELIFLKNYKDLPKVNCDTEMIRVVFQNLIENSIKYSNPNDKVVISLKHNETEKNIEISIHDAGIGIEEKDKSKIFEKFFRAENAKTKDYVGSGLGLFTTKHIIEHHKGKIWFESNPDSGTTFFITLPII